MRAGSRLIERYIVRAITPYLFLSLLLLTTILFTQQASRFGELLMGTRVPLGMVAELALSVLPNVLVFTLPMALLTAILIGFSRMGSDSELTAMRAAGVGTWRMLWPALLLGLLLTALSLYVNLRLAPESARELRQTGEHALLYKLDSPVDPRSFYTAIPHNVIYVREGDQTQGQWGKVFLYKEAEDGSIRIVTARSGRIDSEGEKSELVLTDAVQITLPGSRRSAENSYSMERLEQLRVALDIGRKTVLRNIQKEGQEPRPNEMRWGELSVFAATVSGVQQREVQTFMQKRLAMSLTPLVFAFLGAALGLRVRKGGRGIGLLLSILAMLAYYLLTLAGEQMARAGTIAPFWGGWLATILTITCALALLVKGHLVFLGKLKRLMIRERAASSSAFSQRPRIRTGKVRLLSFPVLLDLNVLRTSTVIFALSFFSLVAVFLIFTLFEIWHFIATKGISMWIVGRYLLFLLPFVSVQLLPPSVLIAMLAAYALMSRHGESIAWWGSGQSIYRLMLPGLVFAACVGGCLWVVQERLMPDANIKQDALRSQIRGEVSRASVSVDKQWVASSEAGRLYSYEYEEPGGLRDPIIYEFESSGVHLRRILKGERAQWISRDKINIQNVELLAFTGEGMKRESYPGLEIEGVEPREVFKPVADKPSHLSISALSDYIRSVQGRGENAAVLTVALQGRYTDPLSSVVLALTGIPLALSFGRKSTIIALCLAIALGLIFWGITGGLRQLGEYGLLPPVIAAWSPIIIFAALGVYLSTRSRT
jgi:LPS export ABC transporter permease LptF/LPS export ABC transporter permease LptG